MSLNYPVGNRYAKKPWQTRTRPMNRRMRCLDCSAQFHESTQETKMDMHCFKMGAGTSHGGQHGLHHGWRPATGDTTAKYFRFKLFRVISDSVDDLRDNYND